MQELEITDTDFVGEINNLFERFIKSSQTLTEPQKASLLAELPRNFRESPFRTDVFIKNAIGWKVERWVSVNFEIYELWKSITINAANFNTEPHVIADKSIEGLKKSFHL